MFGVNKERLLEGLENLQERVCGYSASEQSGCPELRQAIFIISNMSNEEFNRINMMNKTIITDWLNDVFYEDEKD